MTKTLRFMLIISFLFCCFYTGGKYLFDSPKGTTTIIVQANDTLWDIAERQVPREDVRKVIREIKLLNNLEGSTIYRGQELIVPEVKTTLVGMGSGDGATAAE